MTCDSSDVWGWVARRRSRLGRALCPEAFGDPAAARMEAVVAEVLLELEVDVGTPVAVLLDREDDLPMELLGSRRVGEVCSRHHLELLVQDDHGVGLVGERRRAAEVAQVEPTSVEPGLV